MKKNELINKTLAGLMIAAMTAGVCPTTAFAVTGTQVAKDGTYKATAHVTRTEDDEEDEWEEYDVEVSLTVADGKFTDITVTPGDGYTSENASYFNKAYNKKSGIKTLLEGKDATADTVNGWDSVSGATRTSKAVKEAAAAAIAKAEEKTTAAEVNTEKLQAVITKAEGLKEADYTADSWKSMQEALTEAKAALTAKESQDKVDAAESKLTKAIDALEKKPEEVVVNTEKLQAAITKAEGLKEADYTADSWKSMQEALTEAKAALAAKESQDKVDAAEAKLTKAIDALEKNAAVKEVYVLMNIPYDKFYAAEGDDDADAVTSATLNKTRSSLAAGSYHVNSDGSDITGIVYPVKLSDASALENLTQVTDSSKVDITVSMKGKETTTTYEGKDALFESPSYAYYILSETPSYYKEAAVNADGTLSFGKAEGTEVQTLSDVTADFKTSSKYGDYEIDLSGLPEDIKTVYGVVIGTKEGDSYGLRHVENIWRISELAWSTGFTTEVHGSPVQYKDYVSMMGQTINKVTYYTNAGIYEIPANIYVAVKFDGSVEAADAKASSGETKVTLNNLPSDYEPEYSVDGLEDVKVENGVLTYKAADAKVGKYTLKVTDKSGKYADISADFTLTTEVTPITYDSAQKALVPADGYSADDVAAYVKNIASVSVDGKSYAASGKGAVKIINEDGTINTEAAPFADAKEGQGFAIEVTASGYENNYKFTYTAESQYKYVYAALTYSEYWAAEGVEAAGSTEASDVKDTHGEYDKGAFDAVSRATTNHGLHRGNFQQDVTIYDTEGNAYEMSYWKDKENIVLTDGSTIGFSKGTITLADGTTKTMANYKINGIKYVPVKVAAADYDAFKEQYHVVENGGILAGGYSEGVLNSYSGLVADVDANTNGLKAATKNADGTFSFGARQTGTGSGIQGAELQTITPTPVVQETSSFGDFIRMDIKEDYGEIGSKMQTVEWTYYGNGDTPLASYGTKFAADNWMHKSMGVQLGLTDSLRCQLPEGTDGTGKWTVTIYALGYADTTMTINVTADDIHTATPVSDTSALEAAIAKAEALNEADYTADSWASMQTELKEAKDDLDAAANGTTSQESVDESTRHLNAAIDELVKAETEDYKYVYAALTYGEYWAAEDVQAAGSTEASDVKDTHNEYDKGAFDAVSRATTNHGLHRGNFQQDVTIYDTEGNAYEMSYWKDKENIVLTDGSTIGFSKGTITLADGTTKTMANYKINGIKYVPVKVAAADYDAFKEQYNVVENGGTLAGGYSEGVLNSYSDLVADVDANTNGLKAATKNADGTFSFGARQTGTGSGIQGAEVQTITPTPVVQETSSFGDFIRMDIKEDYGEIGSKMQTVEWTYYGNGDTPLASYGTKFAADNWMHKSMGVQLGLTDSLRCQLPEGTDGTGKWTVTIYALGYADTTMTINVTADDIHTATPVSDTSALEAAISRAEALNEADYTADSWASMQTELKEAKDDLDAAANGTTSQESVDESTRHLNAAIDELVKAETPAEVDTSALEAVIAKAEALNKSDYTEESWKHFQTEVASAKRVLEEKASQEAVDSAAKTLQLEIDALEKAAPEETDETETDETGDETDAVDTSSLEKLITSAKDLKKNDYTAATWTTLQNALTNAEKAVEAKESQESVDEAEKNLQAAIDGLKKASATTADTKKNNTTTNNKKNNTTTTAKKNNTTTTSKKSPKTGDPVSVLGLLGAAVSSIGIGGLGLKLRKKSKREDEE